MSGRRIFACAISAGLAAAGLTVAGIGGSAGAAPRPAATTSPAVTTVAGSLAGFTSHAPATVDVPAAEQLKIQLWLPVRAAVGRQSLQRRGRCRPAASRRSGAPARGADGREGGLRDGPGRE